MPAVLAAAGLAALPFVGRDRIVGAWGALPALAAGAGSGVALYLATLVFVLVAARWEPFRADVVDAYGRAAAISLRAQLVRALGVMAPAEEVFWRGLALVQLERIASPGAAAVWSWAGYVAVNAAGRSLPITAASVVGGAVWTVLAWRSGGVLAGLASHILWTGLMLALPPGAGRPAIGRRMGTGGS
jgi:membrane protease YdiL (CAAX protease family)